MTHAQRHRAAGLPVAPATGRIRLKEGYWFGQVNSRPLAFFRIGFALVVLRDALLHLPLAGLFYSESGVAPRAAISQALGQQPFRFSLMDGLSEPWMATLFFLAWAVVALCLLLGFRTRLMTLLNFLFVLSIYWRNPFVISGADDILRVLSFWLLFIPLNQHFSLDRLLEKRALKSRLPSAHAYDRPNTAYAFPVRLIQLQIALIYLATGLFKLLGEQWQQGTAVYYVLQLDSLLSPLGKWLAAGSPEWLLQSLTYQVMLLELAFPILIFVPLGQPLLRTLGVVLAGLMHLGIALAMAAPLFDFLLVMGASYPLFFCKEVDDEGRAERAAMPYHGQAQKRAMTLLLGLLMAAVLWQNGDHFRLFQAAIVPPLPAAVSTLLDVTGLRQGWNLFSPTPLQMDWSLSVPGTFGDGSTLELRTGTAVGALPEVAALPPGVHYRWKRFEQFVGLEQPAGILDAWSLYYCRLYNRPETVAAKRLERLQVRLVYRYSHAPGQPANRVHSELIWMHRCHSGH